MMTVRSFVTLVTKILRRKDDDAPLRREDHDDFFVVRIMKQLLLNRSVDSITSAQSQCSDMSASIGQ